MSYVYMYKTNHLLAKFDFRHIGAMIIIMSHIYIAQNANPTASKRLQKVEKKFGKFTQIEGIDYSRC